MEINFHKLINIDKQYIIIVYNLPKMDVNKRHIIPVLPK